MKKIQMSRFINTELDSDSESDAELMAKLKSDSDNVLNKWLQIITNKNYFHK